jgi:hypothetical protein
MRHAAALATLCPLQREDQTGELWDVENGEAELTLDIGESSLDFYFVRPALLER